MHTQRQKGFALPTILIASFVMLFVLSSVSVSVSSGAITSMDTSHYNRLARQAAESGLEMAIGCLKSNGYNPAWSNSQPLRPNTQCTGAAIPATNEWLDLNTDENVRTTYRVLAPETITTGTQLVTVEANAQRFRTGSNEVWRLYPATAKAVVSSTNVRIF